MFEFLRRLLCDGYQSHRGPEVHLFASHGVAQGHGHGDVPDAARLGPGTETRIRRRLAQYHRCRFRDRERVHTDCHSAE